jgi:restriction endonuclease S subunit
VSELPTGWAQTALEQIITFSIGGLWGTATSNPSADSVVVAVMRGADYRDWASKRAVGAAVRSVPTRTAETRLLEQGDIVVEVSGGGPTQPVGRVVLIDDAALRSNKLPLILSNFCRRIVLSHQVISTYVYYQLLYKYRRGETERFQTATTNIRNLNFKKYLAETTLDLAPRPEQERIVAAIEEQFSRLDAGVAALKRARQNLKRMRAAVLQAAVTGQLTLAVTGPAIDDWSTCTPCSIAANKRNALTIGPFGSSLKVSDYKPQGVPLVFVRQVRSHVFGGADTRFISEEKAEQLRAHRVQGGDVLITKMGEPPGDATVYPADQPNAVITADVIKLSVRQGIVPEYIALAINSKKIRDQFAAITSGVAQQKVSLARFRQGIHIPLPPAEEQAEIVEKVNRWIEEIDQADANIETQLARAASLRSSVLAAAFSGKLVSQDPGDETASIILERIAAERATSNDRKPVRSRKPRGPREEVTA